MMPVDALREGLALEAWVLVRVEILRSMYVQWLVRWNDGCGWRGPDQVPYRRRQDGLFHGERGAGRPIQGLVTSEEVAL